MKKKNHLFIILSFLIISGFLSNSIIQVQAGSKVNKVVKNSRKWYNSTEKKIKQKKLKRYGVKGNYYDYFDSNRYLLKSIIYGKKRPDGYATGDQIKNYTAEYFYDKKCRLVFAFSYRKINGKVKEYRAYFGTDGKVYRYIGPNHKVKNYKKGRNPSGNVPVMVKKMYHASQMNLHYHGVVD